MALLVVALLGAVATAQAADDRPNERELRLAVEFGVNAFTEFFEDTDRVKTRIRRCRLEDATLTCRVRVSAPDARCRFRAQAQHDGEDFLYWQARLRCRPRASRR